MIQEDRRFFYLGMNQDSDPRYLKEGEYIEAKNFYVSSTDGGNDNALENVKSTLEVSYTLPSGDNKCIRIQDDEENQRTYFFIWNSSGNHTILYYKYTDKTLNKLIQDNSYSSSVWSDVTDYEAGDVVNRLISDSFTDADVNTGTGNITLTAHEFTVGMNVVYSVTSGDNYTGLTSGEEYYVYVLDANTIRLCATYEDALVGTSVSFSGSPTGTYTVVYNEYYICLLDYNVTGSVPVLFTGRTEPEKNSLIWKQIGNYLNFQENNFLDSVIIIRDGQTLLFWTDNYNEPKYINVDSYINGDYPVATQPEHLDLCPLQPLHQIIAESAGAISENNALFGKFFQFKYRWVFDDDMYGAWSPISEMDIYSKNTLAATDSMPSYLDLRVYRNSAIDSRLKKIEVAFRECRDGNSGDWYKFAEIDGSDINNVDFTFNTTSSGTFSGWGLTGGGVQYESGYLPRFKNTAERIPLDQNETNQLFSFVPRKAGTIAVTEDNRLVFGDIEESLDVSSVDLDMTPTYSYSGRVTPALDDSYFKSLKTGVNYKWGIRYSDSKGRLSQVLTADDLVEYVEWFSDATIAYGNAATLNMLIGHRPPKDAVTWQLCYLPIGVDYEGSTPLAYQFYAGEDTKQVDVDATSTHSYISLQVLRTYNTDNNDSQIPINFSDEYYVRGAYDDSASSEWADYDESKVIETLDTGEIASISIVSGGSGYVAPVTATVLGGGGSGATVSITGISSGVIDAITFTGGSGYTSAPTIVVDSGNGGGGSGAVILVDKVNYKKYIKIDTTNWNTQPIKYDILEVYKKNTDSNGGLWREFGYPCKIERDSNGAISHGGRDSLANNIYTDAPPAPTQNQVVGTTDLDYDLDNQGDMYISYLNMAEDRVNFPPSAEPNAARSTLSIGSNYFEMPFADVRVPSRSTSLKRPLTAFSNELLPKLNTTLRWSDPLVQNTNINGLGFFYDINFRELKNEYGTIRKVFAENENLKVMFDRKVGLLPMGRTEINSLDGNSFVGKTTDVFGTARYSISDYGVADNPESVSYFGGASIFSDRNKNSVLLSSGLEITEISNKGMKFWFDERFIRSQRLLNRPLIQSSYNKEFDSFFVTIDNKSTSTGSVVINSATEIEITLTAAQVIELENDLSITLKTFSGGLYPEEVIGSDDWTKISSTVITATVSNSSVYNELIQVDVIQGEQYTLNYSPKNQRWMSLFDFKPDQLGSVGNKMVSAKNGEVFLHDDSTVTTYGNFYGTQYESYVTVPFAAEPTNTKNARALEIESTDTNFYLDSGTNERGQSTSLINDDFEEKEGRQWANVLMDENTPLVGGITNPITQGDLMIGTYFIAKINNTATSLVKVFSSTLRYVKSLI